jgi:ribonuclease HIII
MDLEAKAKMEIDAFKEALHKEGIDSSSIGKKSFNYEFTAYDGNSKVKVNVYFGKKGIKTVLQGDENSQFYSSVHDIILVDPLLNAINIETTEPAEYIGTDECGKGDFFGPLVVGAAYTNLESNKILKNIGVRDSKELNESQIALLAGEIKKVISGKYSILSILPAKYNELYLKLFNLNKLLDWAHSKAIENMLHSTNCKYVITDKFKKEELKINSSNEYRDVKFVQIVKAEKFVGVAAASILARDKFNEWFRNQADSNIKLPKGASKEVESFAESLYLRVGADQFSTIAKLHFKTFKRITDKHSL